MKSEQIAFDLSQNKKMDLNNFVVSNCNEQAFKMVENWPEWNDFALIICST